LLNGDEYNVPGQASAAPVAAPNGYQLNLLNQIERLGLNVERHIPVHLPNPYRKVMHQELIFMAGREK
jgi:hypothetical protein